MAELRTRIREHAAQALAAGALDADDRGRAEAGLLPLFDDLAYRYYLAEDGAVYVVDALEPETELQPMTDATMRLAVYRVVAERWPRLAALVPERPAGHSDCVVCRGTGRSAVRTTTGMAAITICLPCRGTGWASSSSHAA